MSAVSMDGRILGCWGASCVEVDSQQCPCSVLLNTLRQHVQPAATPQHLLQAHQCPIQPRRFHCSTLIAWLQHTTKRFR